MGGGEEDLDKYIGSELGNGLTKQRSRKADLKYRSDNEIPYD
jgi:hypothetical protein